MNNIRNIAIIAHVDHGKTTLVDALLRQAKGLLAKEMAQTELIMDSNELEKERGITIFSKNASVTWHDIKINIIDTPGHADFGGEVERVLNMADGCLLLIDAKDGPMPQTRFVLKKALALGLKIIVVINKIDLPESRPDYVLNKTFDLFVELGADDQALDFPVVYTCAKQGLAGTEPVLKNMKNIEPVFEAIIKHIPEPIGDIKKPLQVLVSNVTGDNFKGRIAVGRVHNGLIKSGQEIMHINRAGQQKKYRIISLMTFEGLKRIDVESVSTGDIAAIAGIPDITIGETIADAEFSQALPLLKIDEPTIKMTFMVNDSPFSGKESTYSTSRKIRERLYRELETDMALRVTDTEDGKWIVSGRGELHLSIFIERMRREGYEFQVSRPQVINKEIDGKIYTPYERLYIETPEDYSGVVIQKIGIRKGELQEMKTVDKTVYLEYLIPTRGLIGYWTEFLTDTHGLGIINTNFHDYLPDPGNWKEKDQGSLVVFESGVTNTYGLMNVQGRGILFYGPGVPVYEGEVVGQNSRTGDIWVNVCKTKKLNNFRTRNGSADEHFNEPKTMDLEDALEYIGDDELVEVTPQNVRIRKIILNKLQAKRSKMSKEED